MRSGGKTPSKIKLGKENWEPRALTMPIVRSNLQFLTTVYLLGPRLCVVGLILSSLGFVLGVFLPCARAIRPWECTYRDISDLP